MINPDAVISRGIQSEQGWLSWERFRCETDCTKYPDACISERLIKDTADVNAIAGFREVKCLACKYDVLGCCKIPLCIQDTLCTIPVYMLYSMHGAALMGKGFCRGLKFGLYGDIGTKTCGGYPGMQDHLQRDAQTYADWGVDYLKASNLLK